MPLWKPRACWLSIQCERKSSPSISLLSFQFSVFDPATNKLKPEPATEVAKPLTEAADGRTQLYSMREKKKSNHLLSIFPWHRLNKLVELSGYAILRRCSQLQWKKPSCRSLPLKIETELVLFPRDNWVFPFPRPRARNSTRYVSSS